MFWNDSVPRVLPIFGDSSWTVLFSKNRTITLRNFFLSLRLEQKGKIFLQLKWEKRKNGENNGKVSATQVHGDFEVMSQNKPHVVLHKSSRTNR